MTYTPTSVTSTKYMDYNGNPFTTETDMKWRYMGIDKNGNALIVAASPIKKFAIGYEQGYLQGPSQLDDLCKELYTTSLGEARSIDVEDVNRVLDVKPIGKYYSNKSQYIDNPDKLTIGKIVSEKGESALTLTYTPD